ncbi:MAG: spiro-SPASM protein, partial [Spirochaetes bacterium]|nr:spiro-SPASM protein [Spirochaetota bacterium]
VYKDLPKCFDNKSSLELIFEKAKKNDFDRFILLQNGGIKNIPQGIKNVIINQFYPSIILETIIKEAKSTEDVVIFNAASPFYDVEFIDRMLKRHEKYIADYTYGIGYPKGIIPMIIRKNIIKELICLVKDDKEIKKDYIFYSLSKDINSFDIETFLSDYDLRIFRISLGCNDNGEDIMTQGLYKIFGSNYTVNNIVEYLSKNLDMLYTTVYMLTLELANYSPISSMYYPDNKENQQIMDNNLLKQIVTSVKKENERIRIILGGIGEPLAHDNFNEILKFMIENDLDVIIETTGYNIDKNFIKTLDNIKRERVVFVVKLDAYEKETYKLIHPEGDFEKIIDSISLLKEAGFKVYKQIIRIHENEVEIEKYIRNKESDDLIIRKYSTFCDILSDKKVVDLAPLERIPCFHLRREIYIKADGTVPACIYSRYKNNIGDLNKESITEIIEKFKNLYVKNSKNDYLDFCMNCNDYYLFNF